MSHNHFCPCTDFNCQYNPKNHTEGCDPCIAISLKDREIPRCFFMGISQGEAELITDFSYENFADFVLKHKNK